MKIVSSGKVLNSSKLYKKKKRKKIIFIVLLVLGISALLYSFVYFSREERFIISGVSVLGENIVDRSDMETAVRESITGYYLWVLPKSNLFLYPRRTIEHALVEKFPRLSSASIDLSEKTLYVSVEERLPYALYCGNTNTSASGGKCYFLDNEGLIFALAPSFSGNSYFVYATEEPIEDPLGKRLVEVEEFKELINFIENLELLNIKSRALEVGTDSYSLVMSGGGEIIWRKNNPLTLIQANLAAFLANDSIKTQKDFLDKVLYLNLSNENKVFYKFK